MTSDGIVEVKTLGEALEDEIQVPTPPVEPEVEPTPPVATTFVETPIFDDLLVERPNVKRFLAEPYRVLGKVSDESPYMQGGNA